MANRTGGDRRGAGGAGGDRDPFSQRNPHGPSPTTSKAMPELEEFWLDGEGIDRQVLQASICRFLGPEAVSKPHAHNGRQGYRIRAYRQFTDAMIGDLKDRSRDYIRERDSARNTRGGNELPYNMSNTMKRVDEDMPDYDDGPSYPMGSAAGGRVSGSYVTGTMSMPGISASYGAPITTGSYGPGNYATTGGYGNPSFSPPPGVGQPGYGNPGYQPTYGQPDPRDPRGDPRGDPRAGGYQPPGHPGQYYGGGGYNNPGPGYGRDDPSMRPSGYNYPADAPPPRGFPPGNQNFGGGGAYDNRYEQPGPSGAGRGRGGYPPNRDPNGPYPDQDMYRAQEPGFGYRQPPASGGGRR